MFIGSVAHINVCKKELVQYVHILASLGVPLEDSPKGGFMIYHNSESCLVVEVKSKQHLDHLLKELKESVLSKFNELFSQGGMVYLGTKVDCVCRMWMT